MTQRRLRANQPNVLETARERLLASAVRQRAKSVHFLERCFQEVGCTCGPLRQELQELQEQYRAETERQKLELENSELARRINGVREKIFEIDRAEHRALDNVARQAYAFLGVWLLDQVRVGNTAMLDLGDNDLGRCYAEAWYAGWRPKSLQNSHESIEDRQSQGEPLR